MASESSSEFTARTLIGIAFNNLLVEVRDGAGGAVFAIGEAFVRMCFGYNYNFTLLHYMLASIYWLTVVFS